MAWRKKTLRDNQRKAAKSPFVVDLVAETERIDEEVQVRLHFESQMGLAETKRKVTVPQGRACRYMRRCDGMCMLHLHSPRVGTPMAEGAAAIIVVRAAPCLYPARSSCVCACSGTTRRR